jgi:UDP-N-acetylmuramoyl-tripeptide--D-alanyl-D-alanine ligase
MSLQRSLESYLASCVSRAIRREKPLVVAVAGSVGKSSTKTAVGIALGALEAGSGVVMTEKNYNNELGVPLTVFGASMPGRSPFKWMSLLMKATMTSLGISKLRAKTFVLELGTDHPGDLPKLMKMVEPTVGVLTAIGAEHTEYFGTIEAVAEEEGSVIRMLPEDGVAVVNGDDERVLHQSSSVEGKVVSFGLSEAATTRILRADPIIDEEDPSKSGLEITIARYGSRWQFRLAGTVGRPHAFAAAAAVSVVGALDQDDALAIQRLKASYHGMAGRMRLLEGIKKTWLIDDTYNSSPLAALSALRDLTSFPVAEGGRRIAVMGDMLELGALAQESHEEVGRAAAEAGIDMLVLCGTLAHATARSAIAAGMSEDRVIVFPKSEDAGMFIQERLKQNDVVLIKGSQGIRMERVTKELMARPDLAETLLVRHTKDWLARP